MNRSEKLNPKHITVRQKSSGVIWCCPRCKGDLLWCDLKISCRSCRTVYERIDGIPDLRVAGDSWIDFSEDSARARRLAALDLDLSGLVREVYRCQSGSDEARVQLRSTQVLAGPNRLLGEIRGWLSDVARPGEVFLDLGCGPGTLLAASAHSGRQGIGIDVSMTWLVVAKRMIKAYGGEPVLAAALGEALPLADGAVSAVISLDVIEHVGDPDQYLREIDRVTQTGGHLALSTPNRFSLTAEPHVFVWGVGWLPTSLQARFVRWRSGKSYTGTRLMSSFGLRHRLKRCTCFAFDVIIPPVSAQEIQRFSRLKRELAKIYNRVCTIPIARGLFLLVGPFFRVTGVKR